MTLSIFRIFAFLSLLAFTLAQVQTGSAITVNEDMVESTARIATATTAMAGSGPTTVEATSTESAEASRINSSEQSQSTNADGRKEEGKDNEDEDDEDDEAEETFTSGNITTTMTTKKKEATSATRAVNAPATKVPDLQAAGESFRDPGFIALSLLTALMLFMMMLV